MVYGECPAPPELRSIVDRLWWLQGDAREIAAEPIPPDGRTEIIVHAGAPFVEADEAGRTHVQERVLLAGQMTRPARVRPGGRVCLAGARLRPDAAYRLLGAPQAMFTDRIVSLTDMARPLARRLRDAARARTDARALAGDLAEALRRAQPAADADKQSALIDLAVQRRGLVRVDALARAAGCSARQIERVFQTRVGLSPKMFLRILRFQAAIADLGRDEASPAWAARAAALGFYDQAHFIRDFKQFTGASPTAWQVSEASLAAMFSAVRRGDEV